MLRRLTSSDPRFKPAAFKDGLNLLVSDKTATAADTDSRNSAGKTSLIELIHFCLGASVKKDSLLGRPELAKMLFTLSLDWPRLSEPLEVAREAGQNRAVLLSHDLDGDRSKRATSVSLAEWNRMIERDLFKMPAEHAGISGRTLMTFLARRAMSNSFNSPTRTFPQQSNSEGSANLAYLLGLDWQLAAKYRNLSLRENTRQKLREASTDPVWSRIVGKASELRGQLIVVQGRVDELRRDIDEFRVVPGYETLQQQADDLDAEMRRSRLDDSADRKNRREIEADLSQESSSVDAEHLETLYAELDVVLGDQVRRRYDEVVRFHESVASNRRRYLLQELAETDQRLAERAANRERQGRELSSVLEKLASGGAFSSLMRLQEQYGQELARLETLRNRYEAASALEASRSEIAAERASLQLQMQRDLAERAGTAQEAVLLFSRFASTLYGNKRPYYLEFDADGSALHIRPHIQSDEGRGVGNMAMFCFDLVVAVIAQRYGRGPGFLIHDSHLFDGVEERQVGMAIRLARQVASEEGLQYVMTMNSDALRIAEPFVGVDISGDVIRPRLTDAYEEGGLFGFRF